MAKAKQKAKKEENNHYAWEGTDKKGSKIKGEAVGPSINSVKADLRRQGVNPIKVSKKAIRKAKKKILTKDIAVFSRQLATMMTAGVPLVQAFEIVGRGHDNPSMQDLILGIKSDVEAGASLHEALSKHPLYFDDLYCNLVQAGEQAGVLESLLHKIAEYMEKTEAIKAKIKKAMFYPVAVMVVAFVVTAIMLIFVIPQFEDLFSGFGANLPAFTQWVVDMSRWLRAWWFPFFGSIIGTIVFLVQLKKRSRKFQIMLDRFLLKLPILGEVLHKAAIARFCRTLATMFAAGVPLVEALESVAGATGNVIYTEATLSIRESVSTGQQLQLSMRQTGLFPHIVIQMVAIGEESGSLDTMLGKTADFFEEEVDNAIDALTSLMEPLIMSFLGVVIGGLVIAMYLPIFKLGSAVLGD